MLKAWLSKLEPVHTATSREELEAVYRFRYTVYHKEYGRQLGIVDHDRQWVYDEDDTRDDATILYTGTPKEVTGTIASQVSKHFGPGKRDPVDTESFKHLFEDDSGVVQVDPAAVWGEMQEALGEPSKAGGAFLEALPEAVLKKLVERGFIIQVEKDTLVTRKGHGEQELYVILEGLFEATDGNRRLSTMGPGELFGELAFFLPGHRRAASVTSVTDGRVLVLQSKTLRELIDSDPRTGALVLLRVGRTMAERLANAGSEVEAG